MTLPDKSENWLEPIFDAVVSDVQACGYFDKVNQHEPKRKPGKGLWAAVWLLAIDPVRSSGVDRTSARIAFNLRMYSNMLKEPQDAIDPELVRAASSVMRRYHDNFDFDLDPVVRNVDLLGSEGRALSLITGYVEMDGTMFRIADMHIPVIVNDVWIQTQ